MASRAKPSKPPGALPRQRRSGSAKRAFELAPTSRISPQEGTRDQVTVGAVANASCRWRAGLAAMSQRPSRKGQGLLHVSVMRARLCAQSGALSARAGMSFGIAGLVRKCLMRILRDMAATSLTPRGNPFSVGPTRISLRGNRGRRRRQRASRLLNERYDCVGRWSQTRLGSGFEAKPTWEADRLKRLNSQGVSWRAGSKSD